MHIEYIFRFELLVIISACHKRGHHDFYKTCLVTGWFSTQEIHLEKDLVISYQNHLRLRSAQSLVKTLYWRFGLTVKIVHINIFKFERGFVWRVCTRW